MELNPRRTGLHPTVQLSSLIRSRGTGVSINSSKFFHSRSGVALWLSEGWGLGEAGSEGFCVLRGAGGVPAAGTGDIGTFQCGVGLSSVRGCHAPVDEAHPGYRGGFKRLPRHSAGHGLQGQRVDRGGTGEFPGTPQERLRERDRSGGLRILIVGSPSAEP